jgi:hypothetical protein
MQMGEAEPQEISVATDDEVEAYFRQQKKADMEFGM